MLCLVQQCVWPSFETQTAISYNMSFFNMVADSDVDIANIL